MFNRFDQMRLKESCFAINGEIIAAGSTGYVVEEYCDNGVSGYFCEFSEGRRQIVGVDQIERVPAAWRPTDRLAQSKAAIFPPLIFANPIIDLDLAPYMNSLQQRRITLKEDEPMTNYVNEEQLDVLFPAGHTLEAVTELHKSLCAEALSLVEKKGADYNRSEQQNGDTLANLKMSAKLGLVETPAHGVLVRLLDKLMRLKSLCKPGEKPANVDEKVRDTVVDVINYAVYVLALTEGANV